MENKVSHDAQIYLNAIIDLLPAHIYWKDKNGVFLGCNEVQAFSAGFSDSNKMIGKTDYDMPWKADADTIRANDLEVMATRSIVTKEEYSLLANGERSLFLSKKVPLVDKNDQVIGILGVSFDITERKKMEEDLVKIEAAKKALELADKIKDEFMQNMRHDIITSINGIQGFGQLIKIEAKDKKIDEYADNLVTSCKALTSIHNQILDAIHVFSGEVPGYKNKFSIKERLEQIHPLNLAKACEKGLKLTLNVDKNIPQYLVGDSRRLSGIAFELITNALKYTDQGSVTVNLKLETKKDKDVTLKFTVQDTGIGIAPDKKDEIFMRFNRLTPSYEGKYVGLGLGLSVVKQFVDDMHGEIYVESAPDEGAEFICYLPFAISLSKDKTGVDTELAFPANLDYSNKLLSRMKLKKNEEDAKGAEKTNTKVKVKEKEVKGCAVLVVEDEDTAVIVAEDLLTDLKHTVDVARNGAEALQKVAAKDYDLILMDIGLPDISGDEVTRKIRINEKITKKHVPIIALTAHVDSGSKQKFVEFGMDAVLAKPMEQEKIADMISAFVPGFAKVSEEEAREIVKKPRKLTKAERLKKDRELLNIKGEVVDTKYLTEELKYRKGSYAAILKVAPRAMNEHLENFQTAYKNRDLKMVQAYAHKISGFSSYIGALRLKQICYNLESYLRARKTGLVDDFAKIVIKELKDLQKVLVAKITELMKTARE